MYVNSIDIETIVNALTDRLSTLLNVDPRDEDVLYTEIHKTIQSSLNNADQNKILAEKVGPPMWEYLHYQAKIADKEKKPYIYLELLLIFLEGHPCADMCRKHLEENLRKCPISKYRSCFEHSVALHNIVNQMLNKPTMRYSEANLKYNLDCDSCTFNTSRKSQSDGRQETIASVNSAKQQFNAGARASHRSILYPQYRSPSHFN